MNLKNSNNNMNSSNWDDSSFSQVVSSILSQYRNKRAISKVIVCAILVTLVILSGLALIKGVRGVSEQKAISRRYNNAVALFKASCEDYNLDGLISVRDEFISLGEYKDSVTYANNAEYEIIRLNTYNEAYSYYQDRKYKDAFNSFEKILEYRDAKDLANILADELCSDAERDIEKEEYEAAKNKLSMIPSYLPDEYANAQSLYSQVDLIKTERENARNYEAAVSKYNAKELEDAQKLFMALGEYKDSKTYLHEIGQAIYNDAKTLSDSKDYVNSYERLGLIDTQSEWDNYSQANTLKNDIKEVYVANIENEALSLLDEAGYTAFKEYVNGATNIIFTTGDANTLLNAHKPEYLSDLDPFDSFEWQKADSLVATGWSNYSLYFEDDVLDTYGNYHSHSLLGGGCANGYYLGGKYKRLTGTLFIKDGHRATADQPVFIAVKNGDGDIIYRGELMSGYDNLDFSVDVTGEEQIYIYFDGFYGNFYDSDFYGGAGEVALIK